MAGSLLPNPLRVAANGLLRGMLGPVGRFGGAIHERRIRRRIAEFPREQARLREAYAIDARTPVLSWGPEIEGSIAEFAQRTPGLRFACTSGSTSKPKRVPFTRARLASIREISLSLAARTLARYRIARPALFVLSAPADDQSLTALLLDDEGGTPWPASVIMPSRAARDPALAPMRQAHGTTALRLWLLALSNPSILYSTNPSTLAVFLEGLEADWPQAKSLCRLHLEEAHRLPRAARRIAGRISLPGWKGRLAAVLAAEAPFPHGAWLPGLRCVCTWDGGYVRPFLERIWRVLPAEEIAHVPMYSMSTETVETVGHFDGEGIRFLPLAPGVLYEFLPEGAEDAPEHLVEPGALEPGASYTLVVSDAYGLKRYQTADVFRCRAMIDGVPDLPFIKRRGLAYSFTGEKLTGEQVSEAFEELRRGDPGRLGAGVHMAALPSLPSAAELPRYLLALAFPGAPPALDRERAAASFHRALVRQNPEYAAKVSSGRLAPPVVRAFSYRDLAVRLSGAKPESDAWQSQFKLMPLYTRLWEDHGSHGG